MATTVNPKAAPGVYTQIIDDSFTQPAVSRFRPGLVGVAQKGPFNVPTAVRSLKEFTRLFGRPLTTTYVDGRPDSGGFFLADAVSIVSNLSDGATVVRVGGTYEALTTEDVSGVSGSRNFGMSTANVAIIQSALATSSTVYARITQAGKTSTLNAQIQQAGNGTVSLVAGQTLAGSYYGGAMAFSYVENAAHKAEGVLYAYTYDSYGTSTGADVVLSAAGSVIGNKNEFQFTVQSSGTVSAGSVYKIVDPAGTKATTHEVRVKSVLGNTVYLETSDLTRVGYQAVPLQDTYAAGEGVHLYKATNRAEFMWLEAATEGTWANGGNPTVGLYVQVRPGSAPGSKKFEIYENGGLVETFDNLSDDPDSDDYYMTRINGVNRTLTAREVGVSQYIRVQHIDDTYQRHAANTAKPWDSAYIDADLTLTPKTMPTGRVNAGYTGSGSTFANGYNGENTSESDFIGTINPEDDSQTGLKAFEDVNNVQVNVIACPQDFDDETGGRPIMQEIVRVARAINAMGLADVPANLSGRAAIDWHRGLGQYADLGTVDSPNLAVYWNWFNYVDPFTGVEKLVPPTLAVLRAMAFTFDRDKPWYAAAGETRGVIPEALSLAYPKLPEDVRQAMAAPGNSVNPILRIRGRHVLYGERTMQIADSKLLAVHNVILVNYIVSGLAEIGRRYVFDPNDVELLTQIRLAFSEFLDKVRNERGLEAYELVIDEHNNNADTRNQRQVIVDLAIIPVDVMERMFINCTVKASGATLNTIVA